MTELLEPWLARHPLPDACSTEDKEQRGQVLVIAGSVRVPGAAWLAGRAALHAGAGKLHIATTRSTAIPLALRLPEAMVSSLPEDARGEIASLDTSSREAAARADAILVGPGIADGPATREVVANLLTSARCPCVLDAGAISGWRGLAGTARMCVVTPHAGEVAAATGLTREAVEARPLEIALQFAREAGCVVVMKGVPTYVVDPDGFALEYKVEAPGLGTSGSGDVLAGVLTGLIARGAEPRTAAAWAVWLHGEAGVSLARKVGPIGYLARQISPEIPRIMQTAPAMHGHANA